MLMPGLRLEPHATAADWIQGKLLPGDPGTIHQVGHAVPAGYERYLRLFHPVHAGEQTIRWRDVASASGKLFHPLAQFRNLLAESDDELLAQVFPGSLQYPELSRLVEVLLPWTGDQRCFFAYWEGFGDYLADFLRTLTDDPRWPESVQDTSFQVTGGRQVPVAAQARWPRAVKDASFRLSGEEYIVLSGRLDSVLPSPDPSPDEDDFYPILSPQLWWPLDRRWFVATVFDRDFTLIGAPRGLAEALLADQVLEVAEVDWHDDISLYGDEINDESL
jgi:hypothetical protein